MMALPNLGQLARFHEVRSGTLARDDGLTDKEEQRSWS